MSLSANDSIPMAPIAEGAITPADSLIIHSYIEGYRRSLLPLHHISPLNHSGGKGKSAERLARLASVPQGGAFIDANCGGCAIPLTYARDAGEHASSITFQMRDTNPLLINFWRCLRDDPAKVVGAIRGLVEPMWSTPDQLFAKLIEILTANKKGLVDDKYGVAAAYYIHSIISHPMGQFKLLPGGRAKGKTEDFLDSYALRLGELFRWSALIQGWDFQVRDFRATFQEAIGLGEKAFILSDPPYEGTGRSSYAVEFGAYEHDELAVLVRKANGANVRVMVTLNWSETNAQRYSGLTQFYRTQDWGTRGKSRKGRPGEEMVILSYDIPHLDFFRQQMGWLTAEEIRARQNTNDNTAFESVA
ncbi:MAG: DNA adenine methylase [Magnetospirillum sp.]|nr:DNA adenine methylase [Magnetospirillum sp.]